MRRLSRRWQFRRHRALLQPTRANAAPACLRELEPSISAQGANSAAKQEVNEIVKYAAGLEEKRAKGSPVKWSEHQRHRYVCECRGCSQQCEESHRMTICFSRHTS